MKTQDTCVSYKWKVVTDASKLPPVGLGEVGAAIVDNVLFVVGGYGKHSLLDSTHSEVTNPRFRFSSLN